MRADRPYSWPRLVALWTAVVGASLGLSWLMDLVGVPAPYLFGSLLAGLLVSVVGRVELGFARPVTMTMFVVLGVVTGQFLDAGVLRAVSEDWLPVTLTLLLTLALSVVFGLPISRFTTLSRPTAVFGMIAGGTSGILGVSEAAGADSRIVAIMQYLRLLVVLALLPVVMLIAAPGGAAAPVAEAVRSDPLRGVGFVAVAGVAGLLLAKVLRVPSPALLGPMCLVAVLSVSTPGIVEPVPEWFVNLAFVGIGLQVGLKFNRAMMRGVAALVPLFVGTGTALIVVCAGFAWLLSAWTGRDLLDCYLATTPGGLPAVLAAALEGGVDVPFVTAMQVLRVFVMMISAPMLAAVVKRV